MSINQEQLALALGSKRNWATDELLNQLNTLETDGADFVRENWLTHAAILREGTHSLEQYTTAIKYVSLKQMGHSNQSAYSIALADRYQELVARGHDEKRISSHIAAYHKGVLVQKILAQSVIPIYMLYQDEAHQAIHTLVKLMTDPMVSNKVRADAANSLLTHVKRPEAAKVELSVNHRTDGGMQELTMMMRELADKQLKALQSGADVHDVANLRVIEGECTPVESKS
jgi:hypothetical protein